MGLESSAWRVVNRHRALVFILISLVALVGASALGTATSGAKKRGKTKVSLTIVTKNQAALLKQNSLVVKVRTNRRTRVRLSAARGNHFRFFRTKTVKFGRKASRGVGLRLTTLGRKKLKACGTQKIRVRGKYRRGSRKAKTFRTKKLARKASLCKKVTPPDPPLPDPSTKVGCDPVDPAACIAPFPNDYFTKADPDTDTGIRLDLEPDLVPKNTDGKSAFSDAYNRNDGFSPNSLIVTKVSGLDTPAEFRANGIVSQLNIGSYADPDQRVVLIDTTNNQRVPIWAELDMVPGTPNPHDGNSVQGTAADRTLLIHPAQSLDYGRRYVVALRNLTVGGNPVAPSEVFGYLRDDEATANQQVEERRTQMADVFAATTAAGIDRSTLSNAWEFTVASERNLTERAVTMRDDAYEQLGDNNLKDGIVQGNSPDITITNSFDYPTCIDQNTACTGSQRRYGYRRVRGTITVPCYMNAPGADYNPDAVAAEIPCSSGSRLNYDPGTDLPTQKTDSNGSPVTWEAPFTCVIPRSAENAPGPPPTGLKALIFGHGLLGSNTGTEDLAKYPAGLGQVSCGTDWIGLSSSDLTQHLLKMINVLFGGSDLSLFAALPDRTQQGYVNTLYLARALAHEDGLAGFAEFQDVGGNPFFSVDQNSPGDDLGYYGVSLGGINGGASTALAPDWTRAALAVPGIGFSTLLTRSTQFNRFLPTVYKAYPNPIERSIGMALIQTLWDRGEPSAYSKSILNGGLGTPPHQMVLHESFGDHQVVNTQTETLARTIGSTIKAPILTPGRINDLSPIADPAGKYLFTEAADVDPYWNIPVAQSNQFNQPGGLPDVNSTMVVTDTGPVRSGGVGEPPILGTMANPDWNIAPVSGVGADFNDGYDPHQPGATSPALQQVLVPFETGQGFIDSCGNGAPDIYVQQPFPVPTTSPNPVPCPAPAVDYIRNGK